jgi:hypothetical protein
MASSGMLRRVTLVKNDVSEVLSASIIRVKRIGELGTTLAVTSNRRKKRRNTKWLCHKYIFELNSYVFSHNFPKRANTKITAFVDDTALMAVGEDSEEGTD